MLNIYKRTQNMLIAKSLNILKDISSICILITKYKDIKQLKLNSISQKYTSSNSLFCGRVAPSSGLLSCNYRINNKLEKL